MENLVEAYAYVESKCDTMPSIRQVLDWWNREWFMRDRKWTKEEFGEELNKYRREYEESKT